MRRVVVCGSGFGRIHLRAVLADRGLEPAGLLSRGSDASLRLAEEHRLPSWTSVDQVADDVELACVVVPSGTGAGDGSEVTRALLTRGIHVLQEHPLHPDEIAAAVRTAREHRVAYRVNTLHPHLAPIRAFLEAARRLRARHRPLFIDAACGVQVLCSTLDVVARAVGTVRPWGVGAPTGPSPELAALADTPAPYVCLPGVIGGVPLTLRVQSELAADDPDNHALLLHRVAIGFESGVLSLADTHGPVLWSPRLHSSRDADGRLDLDGTGGGRLEQRSTEVLAGDPAPVFTELFDRVWPDAVGVALRELVADVDDPHRPEAARAGQWALGVATVWQEVSDRLGPIRLIDPPEPAVVRAAELRP